METRKREDHEFSFGSRWVRDAGVYAGGSRDHRLARKVGTVEHREATHHEWHQIRTVFYFVSALRIDTRTSA